MDVSLSAQDLADSYLPPFQSCVEEGKVSGIMCAYVCINRRGSGERGDRLHANPGFDLGPRALIPCRMP